MWMLQICITPRPPSESLKTRRPYLELPVDDGLSSELCWCSPLFPPHTSSHFPYFSHSSAVCLVLLLFDWLSLNGWWCLQNVGWACSLVFQLTEHESSWKLTSWKNHLFPSLCAPQLIIFSFSPPSEPSMLPSHLQLSSFPIRPPLATPLFFSPLS